MSRSQQTPKTVLNNFGYKAGFSVTYDTQKVGEQYQSTVTLIGRNGEEFAGEPANQARIAEQFAALQALYGVAAEAAQVGIIVSKIPVPVDGPVQIELPEGAERVFKKRPVDVTRGPEDAKNTLNNVAQALLTRGLKAGQDVIYTTANIPGMGFQCTVSLPTMGEGEEFAGECCADAKDAEKSAALIAVQAHMADIQAYNESCPPVDPNEPRRVKDKHSSKKAPQAQIKTKAVGGAIKGGGFLFPMKGCGKGAKGGIAKPAAGIMKPAASWPGVAAQPKQAKVPAPTTGPVHAKNRLNQFLQKSLGRGLNKADVTYSEAWFDETTCQATVTLVCKDGVEFAGETADTKVGAENLCAQQALQAFADEAAVLGIDVWNLETQMPTGVAAKVKVPVAAGKTGGKGQMAGAGWPVAAGAMKNAGAGKGKAGKGQATAGANKFLF